MKVATFTNNDEFCLPECRCLAYIVLPNGEYWGVRFNGATEDEARNKAVALWTKEQEKFKRLGITSAIDSNGIEHNADPWAATPPPPKVWMRKGDNLKRVPLTEITMYEKQGYVRSGPRSKPDNNSD